MILGLETILGLDIEEKAFEGGSLDIEDNNGPNAPDPNSESTGGEDGTLETITPVVVPEPVVNDYEGKSKKDLIDMCVARGIEVKSKDTIPMLIVKLDGE